MSAGPSDRKRRRPASAGELATLVAAGEGELDLETIAAAIEARRPLAEVLDLVVARASVLLDACQTYILLREGDWLMGAAQRGLTSALASTIRIPVGQSIEGWVATRRRPLAMRDPETDPRFRPLADRQGPIASIIALPLQVRGSVLGVLTVATREKTDFADSLLLLLVLADLATLAIESGNQSRRELRRARLVDLLRYVSSVDYGTDLGVSLGPVADRIAEVMGAEKVDVMFWDDSRAALVSLGVSDTPLGRKQRELGLDIVPAGVPSLLLDALATGESTLLDDARTAERVYRPLVDDLGIRSLMISPLDVGGARCGVLACASTQIGVFTPEDLAVEDLIARRLSLAFQHIELTADLTRLEAERLDRIERDNFFELLAHDLKNPLATLKGYSQLAGRRLRAGDAAYVARALQIMNDKVDQLDRLLNDMLEVTRLSAGTFNIQRQEIDLVELVKAEVEAAQLTSARHVIVLTAPPGLGVHADRGRLAEVCQNLLANAIRYSPGGGTITVVVGVEDGHATVEICDEGPGIAPEDLPRIFERAYRGRGQQITGGLGLGLYISREIVRLHAGRIWVESPPGQGACLHVALPASRTP